MRDRQQAFGRSKAKPSFGQGSSKKGGSISSSASYGTMDEGLRSYMLSVYNYMVLGLVFTGLAAYMVADTGLLNLFYNVIEMENPETEEIVETMQLSLLGWVAVVSPLIMVIALSAGIKSMSASSARGLFFAYSAVMGVSLAPVTWVYTDTSIVRVFLITSITFAGMSLYGYTTKRDLTGLGAFLLMGLWGLIVASLVNIFMHSQMMYFVTSCVGVLIFVLLTAYDTQKIKHIYYEANTDELREKCAIIGALELYLDFINLFLYLLRFFGDRE